MEKKAKLINHGILGKVFMGAPYHGYLLLFSWANCIAFLVETIKLYYFYFYLKITLFSFKI